jgi:hypothetical protein
MAHPCSALAVQHCPLAGVAEDAPKNTSVEQPHDVCNVFGLVVQVHNEFDNRALSWGSAQKASECWCSKVGLADQAKAAIINGNLPILFDPSCLAKCNYVSGISKHYVGQHFVF